jgi:ABC-type polysaccharide/polyol phosphate transport system ATPase subunit
MAVIEFEHVSKTYQLGASRTSLREAIFQGVHQAFSRNGGRDDQLFWALNDVSFQVEQGEVLGIIGHNGAGKSTILKLLSKVTFPSSGRIHTQGRMAALIELGAGFHQDLSGRENIYLNGSILGLKKREIDAQFSNIVEFAGLERFIDTPVKRYSSGMYVRLAFAVAAHVKADLLLVDEVLSVGDAAFQQKCLAKMNELRDGGATIVFVSHNLWSVGAFCKRAFLLRAGQIEAEGNPDEVIQIYRQQDREALMVASQQTSISDPANAGSQDSAHGQTGETIITKVELLNRNGLLEKVFSSTDHLIIRTHYFAPKRIETPVFVIRIRRADGLICCEVMSNRKGNPPVGSIQGQGIFEVCIDPLQLTPDIYAVETYISDSTDPIVHAASHGETFQIKGYLSGFEHTGVFEPNVTWSPHRVIE